MKVIHISRKQKITRTSYEWYRAKNKIKSFYHKIGALAFGLVFALTVGTIGSMIGLYEGIDPILSGGIAAFISLIGTAILTFSRYDLAGGLLFVLSFNCNYGLGNTGTDCIPTYVAPKKLIFMSYYNATGAQNRFALSNPGTIYTAAASKVLTGIGTTFLTTFTVGDIVVLAGNSQVYQILSITSNTVMGATSNSLTTQGTPGVAYNQFTNIAYWNALCNHPDPTRRIFPVDFIKNGENIRNTDTFETFDDNTKQSVLQGVREFKGMIPKSNASPQLQGRLNTFKNSDLGFYWVDYNNNLAISDTGDGFAYPIRIDQNSFMALFNPGVAKKGMKIDIEFDIHSNEIDSNMNLIAASNFQTVQMGNLKGLKDVTGTPTVSGHATLKLAFATIFGDAVTPTAIHGLTLNNFVSNVTGLVGAIACTGGTDVGTDIVVSACAEQNDIYGKPNGTYILTLTAASSTDALALNVANYNGGDFSSVNVTSVILT